MNCPNCKPPKTMNDHAHQLKNFFGDTVTTWWLDGKEFHTTRGVQAHLRDTYGLTYTETIEFLRKIPTKYN